MNLRFTVLGRRGRLGQVDVNLRGGKLAEQPVREVRAPKERDHRLFLHAAEQQPIVPTGFERPPRAVPHLAV